MSIRKKTLLFFIAIFSALIIITTLVLDIFAQNKFSAMEKENESNLINHIDKTLRFNLQEMKPLLDDWTVWEDMYNFAEKPNQSFIDGNLSEDTLRNLDIQGLYVLNSKNDIVFQGNISDSAIYSESGESETSDFLRQIIPLLKFTNQKDYLLDLIGSDGDVYFVAAHTILNSKGEGPSHGSFVIFKKLDLNKPKSNPYLESIDTTIKMFNTRNNEVKTNYSKILQDLKNNPVVFNEVSEQELKSYKIINDVFKQPLILLESTNTREIYQEGQNLMVINALIMTIISIFFGIFSFFSFKTEVIDNFSKLSDFINEHTKNPGSEVRLTLDSNTEMTEISESFNNLLDKLESQGQKITKQTTEIETKAAEVLTSRNDLYKTNQELQELNKYMVGREMKMIELKKEVEDLKAKLQSVPLP